MSRSLVESFKSVGHSMRQTEDSSHCDLIARGHLFLLQVLPLRHEGSQAAISSFLDYVARCGLPVPVVDAVLLRCLSAIDRSDGRCGGTLIERYVAAGDTSDYTVRFKHCVEDWLRCRAVANPLVARALAIIEQLYSRSSLQASLATRLGVPRRVLCKAFVKSTGMTPVKYLRYIRLSHAAALLTSTHKRVKEISALVGYTDEANFNHQFRERFNTSPSEYRRRGMPRAHDACELSQEVDSGPHAGPQVSKHSASGQRVLLVDRDETAVSIVAAHLRHRGYDVVASLDAEEGLRRAASVSPALALVEQDLGGRMNGVDCLREVRRQRHRTAPAVALLTGNWNVLRFGDELRELGAHVLLKPCGLSQIQDLVADLVGAGSGTGEGGAEQVVARPKTG